MEGISSSGTPPRLPRKHRGRIFLRFFFVSVVLLGAGLFWFFRDAPPPEDADLVAPNLPQIKDISTKGADKMVDLRDLDFRKYLKDHGHKSGANALEVIDDITLDLPVVEAFLAQASPAYAAADAAINGQLVRFMNSDSPDYEINNADFYTALNPAWRIRAQWHFHEEQWTNTLADARQLLDAADNLRGSYGMANCKIEMENSGLALLAAMAVDARTPREVLTQLRALIRPAGEDLSDFDMALRGLYSGLKKGFEVSKAKTMVRMQIRLEYPNRASYPNDLFNLLLAYWATVQPNRTMAEIGERYREMIAASDKPFADFVKTTGLNTRDLSFRNDKYPRWKFLLRNGGGRWVVDSLLAHPKEYFAKAYNLEAEKSLLQTGLALRLFWEDYHVLPHSLDALVPKYLPFAPHDPFDGKPLHYNPKEARLWSVGQSLTDQHGSAELGESLMSAGIGPFLDKDQPTLDLLFVPSAEWNKARARQVRPN